MTEKLKNVFLYGGVSREEFRSIKPLVWRRNRRILTITSLLAIAMAAIFLGIAVFSEAMTWFPYFILLCASVLILAVNKLTERSGSELLGIVLCYAQTLAICIYAGVLSVQASNYAIPATSIVVFIALLPLTVDDRLVRMFGFMIAESAAYLVVSKFYKSSSAFSLDVINVGTFLAVGMALYGVICTRNIREIYQGVRIEKLQRSMITSLATVVEERDESTGGHIVRTEDYVGALLEKMKQSGLYDLTDEYCANILLAAPMHDIGKIRIPDAILNKPGKLTDEEFKIMKKHAEYGAAIIDKTVREVEEESYFSVAGNIARHHHERYDGAGYPDGLKGEEIPLEARVMAIADVYDALVSERVYKKPFSQEESKRIIAEGAGTQFDPILSQMFLDAIK